ncbi:hypothetical protein GCM10022288_15740 [Gryllotalpicola kribbensis]|uniref:Uncharacterized protein n=1 Tax=Gryllotalpicola kribbensis TaxID=993084 RepID=A0ABP8ARL6_9MICO
MTALSTSPTRPLVVTQIGDANRGVISLSWSGGVPWHRRRPTFDLLAEVFDLSGYTPRDLRIPMLVVPRLPHGELVPAIERLERRGATVELRVRG